MHCERGEVLVLNLILPAAISCIEEFDTIMVDMGF